MSAVTAIIGINSLSSGVITKVTTSLKLETRVLTDYSGAFNTAQTFDPKGDFSVEGKGVYPSVALGVTTGALIPSTVTGGIIIIDSYSQTEKETEYPEYKYSGKWRPGAS